MVTRKDATYWHRHWEKIRRKVEETDPNEALRIWYNNGLSLSGSGHLEQSIKYFDKASEIDPSYSPVCINKIVTLYRLGRTLDNPLRKT
jgi:tetratricopeptide (TPR) repeat protein